MACGVDLIHNSATALRIPAIVAAPRGGAEEVAGLIDNQRIGVASICPTGESMQDCYVAGRIEFKNRASVPGAALVIDSVNVSGMIANHGFRTAPKRDLGLRKAMENGFLVSRLGVRVSGR